MQIHLPQRARIAPPAVVVFQAPDGTFRFPGDPNGLTAAKYEKLGYTRQEHRGWAEVRKLESRVNKQQYSEIMRKVEREQEWKETGTHARRSDFHHGLHAGFQIPETEERIVRGRRVMVRTGRMKHVKLGAMGRDVAMAAVERNNRKPGPTAREAGFHVEVYSNDRSNRDGHGRRD